MKGMSVKVWGIRKPIKVRVNVRNCDSIGVKVAATVEQVKAGEVGGKSLPLFCGEVPYS